MSLTWDEIDLEAALERGTRRAQSHVGDDWTYETQNGSTAISDALKDRSGPGWDDFQMERQERRGDRSARP
jgi:hypothetical protein